MSIGVERLTTKALAGFVKLFIVLGMLLFLPAWTLNFWQAWVFLLVFSACVWLITLDLLKRDPRLVERRIKGGPLAEKEKSQKVIQALASVFSVLVIVAAGLDHRFGRSGVPASLVITGDAGIALAFLIMFLVLRENSFASAIIEVDRDQRVISTGPYRVVRHPMYAGALLMYLFLPLALGSYWALLPVPPVFAVIVLRLLKEESYLAKNLPGYDAYRLKTRYRLAPGIW